QTVGGDERVSRRYQQVGPGRRITTGRRGSARAEDAGTERGKIAWRGSLQRDPAAYGGGRRDPRSFEVACGGAEGHARTRSRKGAGAWTQGTVALHGAAELSQQLAAPRLHRG